MAVDTPKSKTEGNDMKHYIATAGWMGLTFAALYVTGMGVVTVVATLTEWGLI